MSNLEEFNQRYEGLMKYYGEAAQHPIRPDPKRTAMRRQSITVEGERWSRRCCCEGADFGSMADTRSFSRACCTAECGPADRGWPKRCGDAGVAGAANGIGQTGARKGGLGQSDPRGAELVLGEQPFDGAQVEARSYLDHVEVCMGSGR